MFFSEEDARMMLSFFMNPEGLGKEIEAFLDQNLLPFYVVKDRDVYHLHRRGRKGWLHRWTRPEDDYISIIPFGGLYDISWYPDNGGPVDKCIPFLTKFLEDRDLLAPALTWDTVFSRADEEGEVSFILPEEEFIRGEDVFREAQRLRLLYFKPDHVRGDFVFCRYSLVSLFWDNHLDGPSGETLRGPGYFERGADINSYTYHPAPFRSRHVRRHLRGGRWVVSHNTSLEDIRQKIRYARKVVGSKGFSVSGG